MDLDILEKQLLLDCKKPPYHLDISFINCSLVTKVIQLIFGQSQARSKENPLEATRVDKSSTVALAWSQTLMHSQIVSFESSQILFNLWKFKLLLSFSL